MKKIMIGLFLMMMAGMANAQMLNPILWTFTSKKLTEKTYEVHIIAVIQNNWHLYSQIQPTDAITMPTEILFNKNPLISLVGKTKEVGKMEVYADKKLGISANQYAGRVEFIQKITLKSKSKTNISGSVEYQTCDDKKCLPPKKMPFSIALK